MSKDARLWGRTAAALGTAAAMIMVGGCGGGDKAATDENGKPIVTIMSSKNSTTKINPDETKWFKELEAACDCTIKWDVVSVDAWQQQKNVVLTSGEVADISIGLFEQSDLAAYPYFEDLSDDLDKLPAVKKFFESRDYARKSATSVTDGKIYQIPNDVVSSGESNSTGQNLMINKAWLDKLGLEIPQTWDELTKVLEAFKTQDPNGNGKADEIPFNIRAMETQGFGWYSPFQLIDSTGISTAMTSQAGMEGVYVKDGKVGNFLQTDNFRKTVEYLRDLTAKGLIPKDGWSKDSSKWESELKSDGKTAITGMAINWNTASFGDLQDQYEMIPIPSATDDPADATAEQAQDASYNGLEIRADAPNKEAVFKVIEKMMDTDISVGQYFGDLGTYVEKIGDLHYKIKEDAFDGNSLLYGMGNRGYAYFPKGIKIENNPGEQFDRETRVYREQAPGLDSDDFWPGYVTPSDEDTKTLADNRTQLLNYVVTQTAQWVSEGGLDDTSWKEFQDKIKTLGVEDNIKLWQKWYDEYAKL
ncbi:ABC transporter [Bifidobacterium hapali]|uniref:ABC transporter n=1 Tax=Bifidobacterium hapali TaxID=1630172 RepID=A0A261FWQ3_9BIFI|nr:extracellular solute-binding protein [Bifidobacterium hapali]OZG63548.1 ABC transporter [Bifidobacterium hapali]